MLTAILAYLILRPLILQGKQLYFMKICSGSNKGAHVMYVSSVRTLQTSRCMAKLKKPLASRINPPGTSTLQNPKNQYLRIFVSKVT